MTHFIGSLLAFIFYFNLFLPGTVTDINIKSAEDCTSEFRYCKWNFGTSCATCHQW